MCPLSNLAKARAITILAIVCIVNTDFNYGFDILLTTLPPKKSHLKYEKAISESLKDFSINFWINYSEKTSAMRILCYNTKEGDELLSVVLLRRGIEFSVMGKVFYSNNWLDLPLTTWHSVMLTVSSTTSLCEIYINGWFMDSVSTDAHGPVTIPPKGTVIIWQLPEEFNGRFNDEIKNVGRLRNVNIWNYILPYSYIANLCHGKVRSRVLGNVFQWTDKHSKTTDVVILDNKLDSYEYVTALSTSNNLHLCANDNVLLWKKSRCDVNATEWEFTKSFRMRNIQKDKCLTAYWWQAPTQDDCTNFGVCPQYADQLRLESAFMGLQLDQDCWPLNYGSFVLSPKGKLMNVDSGQCVGYKGPSKEAKLINCTEAEIFKEIEDISRNPGMAGWKFWNETWYLLQHSHPMSWREAHKACQAFRNASLLTVHSVDEKLWLDLVANGEYWIGLTDTNKESVFVWHDGAALKPAMRSVLNDDRSRGGLLDCVYLSSSSDFWKDDECTKSKGYICKTTPSTSLFEIHKLKGLSENEAVTCSAADTLLNAMETCLRRENCTGVVELPRKYCLAETSGVIGANSKSTLYVKAHCKMGLSGFFCDSGQPVVETPITVIVCECLPYFISPELKVCGRTAKECTRGCTLATCDNCRPVCNDAGMKSTPLMRLIWHRIANSEFYASKNGSHPKESSSIFVDVRAP
uniref:Uncharacterized protein LOC116949413 isoform X1 n=3 Tax=Petromyzon marinus TaxID=7757 RepID=A0AAJ7TTA9_PETMA|nr:uncharacterized protein LOC116949413 isoform X1 [Petromyzon marinus]